MSQITFSPNMEAAVNTYFFRVGATQTLVGPQTFKHASSTGILTAYAGGTPAAGGRILIMKGVPPADATALNSLTLSSRTSDILMSFDASAITSSSGFATLAPSVYWTNPATFTSSYVNATASGVATWFWITLSTVTVQSSVYDSGVPRQQIVGTVGDTGSGADLTLPTANIVAGTPYRIYNFRLALPNTWTY